MAIRLRHRYIRVFPEVRKIVQKQETKVYDQPEYQHGSAVLRRKKRRYSIGYISLLRIQTRDNIENIILKDCKIRNSRVRGMGRQEEYAMTYPEQNFQRKCERRNQP